MNTYRIWRIHPDGTATHICDRKGTNARNALDSRFHDSDLARLTGKIAVAHIDPAHGSGGIAIYEIVSEPSIRRVFL